MFPHLNQHEREVRDDGRLPDMVAEDSSDNCHDIEQIYFSR